MFEKVLKVATTFFTFTVFVLAIFTIKGITIEAIPAFFEIFYDFVTKCAFFRFHSRNPTSSLHW
ncbi:MAG: hypothetical protein ACTSRA_10825 [Promethearchaeota archaeon]